MPFRPGAQAPRPPQPPPRPRPLPPYRPPEPPGPALRAAIERAFGSVEHFLRLLKKWDADGDVLLVCSRDGRLSLRHAVSGPPPGGSVLARFRDGAEPDWKELSERYEDLARTRPRYPEP